MEQATCCGPVGDAAQHNILHEHFAGGGYGHRIARVGIYIGVLIAAVAFFPKVAAVVIAIPTPVAAAYITVLLGLLFVQGMKIIIQDGVDHRKATVAGVAFWIGTGFQNQWIYGDLLGEGFLSVLLGNGMTSGAIAAVIMMVFLELTAPRRRKLEMPLNEDSLALLTEFLTQFATRIGWSQESTNRLVLVGEETLNSLATEETGERADRKRRLMVRGPGRRLCGGTGVSVGVGGHKPGGPAHLPGRTGRRSGRKRNFLPAAASLRFVGAPPEVPRN